MKKISVGLMVVSLALMCGACQKLVPEDKDTIDPNAMFLTTTFEPILGRATLYQGIFSHGESTVPLEFEVINLKRYDGTPAPELTTDVYPVITWKTTGPGAYNGLERSLAEIEAKRDTQYHRIFEMRKYSGDVAIWPGTNTSKLLTKPDSGYKFDVKVSNSGATRYFYNLRFIPYKPIPYEPSNFNRETGMTTNPVLIGGGGGLNISGIFRARDNNPMSTNEVDVYITKIGPGNSLAFKFLDSIYRPIDPSLFAATDWENLVHGFDVEKTNTMVKYKVAYPIPLVNLRTRYTNSSGNRANVRFGYYRLGPGGIGIDAYINFQFAIYDPGEWEITFHFKNTSPKFAND